ncbi:ExeA family protein [Geoalkalibacter sp.]|uniref:ExeA family protein n=1 Tax=Geoalkalibacter sp. TaxID=3041440 RepID=UPI00272E145D|nr:AAA family ATPase [Geoalkalibacter sp.]
MATPTAKAYQMEFQPIILKKLCGDADISQAELARAVADTLGRDISRPTLNLCVNRGYVPMTIPGFREAVEAFLSRHSGASQWLIQRGLTAADVWRPLDVAQRNALPAGHGSRTQRGMRAVKSALISGDPEHITITWEVAMLHPETMKKFKLFRHPFLNDITSEKDIFLSDEHRYIESAMMDAALHGGFLAVIGEVQSGKSTIRKKVVENLLRDGDVSIVYPRNHRVNIGETTRCRINATSLCDAIILDISGETPKVKTEHKVRQLERLLIQRTNQGLKHVLIIEEAHNLTKVALKYLKQFYELEDGFRKLMSIILIGQTELRELLNERAYPELREVIRRIQVAEIKGLNGNLRDYLKFKFNRVGAQIDNIFTPEACESLSRRLTCKDNRSREISNAYPGLVNSYVTRAMNLAWEMGEEKVTADVVEAI